MLKPAQNKLLYTDTQEMLVCVKQHEMSNTSC